ncbi:HAMP domain-containing protein [Roseiflexus castenholzii]|uniref:Anti-sigma-factor antagonist n=1 Tax=Roseiflexus castenholzii (strain DSM 13941 / HLO8) TaxID=383372 RepID=A7NQP9_ROSCS|nr:HAMP domain-containing protein [Roseiflexus castenholzii]ABU59895.1 anti-sigma-factor antagonist [Roseiflexus castenholzii DSM 13941]
MSYSYLQTGDPGDLEEGAELLERLQRMVAQLRTSDHIYGDFQEEVAEQHIPVVDQGRALLQAVQDLHHRLSFGIDTPTDAQREAFYQEIERIEEQRETFTKQANAHLAGIRTVAQQHIEGDVRLTFVGIAIALAAMVALTIGVLWLIERHIVRPLRSITNAASRLAEGRLDGELAITSNDEIGVLQQTFNRMAATIRRQTGDLEIHYRQVTQARDALEAAHRQAVEQLAIIQRQQEAIRKLSVPVLPVSRDTPVMPLVGALDSARLIQVQEQALERLAATRARRLLLDITGVPIVDSHVAQGLIRVVQAAHLLGAEVMLIGIRPEVAQSIVGLGISLSNIRTCSDLQSALAQKGGRL